MAKTPEEKKGTNIKKKRAGGRGRRPPRGEYRNSLDVLIRLLETENFDRALREISEYIVSLMKISLFGLFTLDWRKKELKLHRAETEEGEFYFLKGLCFPSGESETLDSWVEKLTGADITEYTAEEYQKFLINLADENVLSDDVLGAVVHRILSDGWKRVFFVNGETSSGFTTFCSFVYSREVPPTHRKLMKALAESAARGINIRLSRRSLREKLIKYEAIVESQARSYFLLKNGRIEFFSRHLPAMLGVPAENIKGRPLADFFEGECAGEITEVVDSFSKNGHQGGKKYFRVVNLADSSRGVEIQLDTADFKGEPAVRGTLSDISESTQQEQRLLREKHMEDIATMAGGVAHDFNNLIGAMIGYSSVVRKSLPEYDRRVRQLDKIEEAGIRARKLTGQLLSISRKGKYRMEIVDLAEVIGRVVKRCVVPMDEVSFNISEEVDTLNVEGDSSQLYEAFLNICMNAREAMPDGGEVEVVLRKCRLDMESRLFSEGMKPGDYVKVVIRDRGMGISDEILNRVEVPFFTTKDDPSHKGLGLPAAKGIVENHRGKMVISSRENEGTEVMVFLPSTVKEAEPVASFGGEKEQKQLNVLVVDDEKIVCELASEMLSTLGHRAFIASSGSEGLEILKEEDIDLVVLDLVMPEMNGQEVFRRIKGLDSATPVVISSGYSEDEVVRKLLREGAVSFLKKPYRLEDFSSVLDRVFVSGVWDRAKER
jgi:PAS domain S-box-containing protein